MTCRTHRSYRNGPVEPMETVIYDGEPATVKALTWNDIEGDYDICVVQHGVEWWCVIGDLTKQPLRLVEN